MGLYIERKLAILEKRVKVKRLEDQLARTWVGNPFCAKPAEVTAFNKREPEAKHNDAADAQAIGEQVARNYYQGVNIQTLFGGGWIPHKPGDFIPEHQKGMEYLVDEDPRVNPGKVTRVRPYDLQNNECWKHTPGFVFILGYRHAKSAAEWFTGTPTQNGVYYVEDESREREWHDGVWHWIGSGGKDCYQQWHENFQLKLKKVEAPADPRLELFGGDWTPYKAGDPIPAECLRGAHGATITCLGGQTLHEFLLIKKADPKRKPWVIGYRLSDHVWAGEGAKGAACENQVIAWRIKK